jgi:serine/threonine protein kinase
LDESLRFGRRDLSEFSSKGLSRLIRRVMRERDLILGVLATQAGFLTPTQVMTAVASQLVERDESPLLARLEVAGALTPARRKLLEAMADEALMARNGSGQGVLETLGGEAAVLRTFGNTLVAEGPIPASVIGGPHAIPAEREGQYTRLGELGRGGQSVVCAATDEVVGREVALKELHSTPRDMPSDASEAARARFIREVRLIGQLDHPGIVSVYELAQRADGTLFCAQKLIRGETLKTRVARCATVAERLELLPHLIDACHAVAYAHSKGVIHRDLKPSNIMVGDFGQTTVVDWGLAKKKGEPDEVDRLGVSESDSSLSVAGVALGTPAYMSPEQARGALPEIDERSDVFSLGAILYELLTARPPFDGVNAEQMIEAVLAGRFRRVRDICPGAPLDLAAVAERALRSDPNERYSGAEALAKELVAFRAGGRVGAYEYRSWTLLKKFVARNRALTAASATALGILLASAVVIALQLKQTRINLATSLLERAGAAQQSSEWSRAAGYYAASRIEHDSREARWGIALSRERIPRRLFARQGKTGEYVDAVLTPNGSISVLGLEESAVFLRELETGRELWRYELSEPVRGAFISGNKVNLLTPTSARYLDLSSGNVVASFERATGAPCLGSPPTSRVLFTLDGLLLFGGAGQSSNAPKVGNTPVCTVSDDGKRLAFRDLSGVVHLWTLSKMEEIASWPVPDANQLFFTAHGLAAVRTRSVQVFGGPEGDFLVDVPSRIAGGALQGAAPGGSGLIERPFGKSNAMSPDGHFLVVASLHSGQADIIDLLQRRIVSSVPLAAGRPNFTFSSTGDRLLTAGLANSSLIVEWELAPRLRVDAFKSAPVTAFYATRDSSRILVYLVDANARSFELRDITGKVLRTGPVPGRGGIALSGNGRRIALADIAGIGVQDADSGQTVGHFDCEGCWRVVLSNDGSRLLAANAARMALWDVEQGRLIWSETKRLGRLSGPLSISPDGRWVVWARARKLYAHSESSEPDQELQLDEVAESAAFDSTGARLAIVTHGLIGTWTTNGLRPLWHVPNPSWVGQWASWSTDDSAIIVTYDSLGTVLLDSETGQRFASFTVKNLGAFDSQHRILPDLRHEISEASGAWELTTLPLPDSSSPRDSLAKVLTEGGLELRDGQLVDALAR